MIVSIKVSRPATCIVVFDTGSTYTPVSKLPPGITQLPSSVPTPYGSCRKLLEEGES